MLFRKRNNWYNKSSFLKNFNSFQIITKFDLNVYVTSHRGLLKFQAPLGCLVKKCCFGFIFHQNFFFNVYFIKIK